MTRPRKALISLADTPYYHILSAAEEELRFQRKASIPRVALTAIPKIKQYLRRKGQAFLEEMELYLAQHETDDDPSAELSVSFFITGRKMKIGKLRNEY